MVTTLLDLVFGLCLVVWFVWLTVMVVLASQIAVEAGKLLTQTVRRKLRSGGDSRFLRTAGIKR